MDRSTITSAVIYDYQMRVRSEREDAGLTAVAEKAQGRLETAGVNDCGWRSEEDDGGRGRGRRATGRGRLGDNDEQRTATGTNARR